MSYQKTQMQINMLCNVIGGEIVSSEFPHGYDGVLFAHFIDIFPEDVNKNFFIKAFNCLKEKGILYVLTPVVNDNETGPLLTSVFSSYFLCLANGKGRFYSSTKIIGWMYEAGFSNIQKQSLPMSEVLIIATKP